MENYLRDLLKKQQQRIAELEKQLAEKDKKTLALFSALYDVLEKQDTENVSSRIDYLTKQNNGAISDFYKEHKILKQALANTNTQNKRVLEKLEMLVSANQELEAKLAESEKQLNRYRSMKNREQLVKENESLKDTIAVVLSQKSEWIKSYDKLKQQLAEKNQDKISFCIEKLEKVKKYSNEKFEWWENREWEIGVFEKTDVSNAYFDIEVKVDDLIKELKGEE